MNNKKETHNFPLRFPDKELFDKVVKESEKEDRSANKTIIRILKEYFKTK